MFFYSTLVSFGAKHADKLLLLAMVFVSLGDVPPGTQLISVILAF